MGSRIMTHSGISSMGEEVFSYVKNIKNFGTSDWLRYVAWIGTISSLFFGVSFFLLWGASQGVRFPGYVWVIPIGTGLFTLALAIDDIGHRTLYKADLKKGEAIVHQQIVITAVTSVMALCLCYEHGETFHTVAFSLTLLSFFYSIVDEALHWHRYLTKGIDRVEGWAHFIAITGHVLMISAWWNWYQKGYLGVAETVEKLPWR